MVVAVSRPLSKRNAVTSSSSPDSRYVEEIIGLRPILSKNRPSISGPSRLPTAITAK